MSRYNYTNQFCKPGKSILKCPIIQPADNDINDNVYNQNSNNNANKNNNAKFRENHNTAMSAKDAQELCHRAHIEQNKHYEEARGSGEAGKEGSGGGRGGGEESKASEPVKIPDEVTQFRWATLQLGGPAPGFRGTAVVDGDFEEIALEDYRGKWVVFFFYPLDFTFVCPTEIIAFSDKLPEFEAINTAVVACSTDSHFSHLAWTNTPRNRGGLGPMAIPILADKGGNIARRWGVLKEDEGNAFRGLFIIDPAGNLRQITINDMNVGRCIEETLRLVQAFQFTDEWGEVCPMGWKPGDATIKPDPKGKLEFFVKNKD